MPCFLRSLSFPLSALLLSVAWFPVGSGSGSSRSLSSASEVCEVWIELAAAAMSCRSIFVAATDRLAGGVHISLDDIPQ